MKVTEDEIKYRQLHTEGCLQKVPAEKGEYAGAYASSRITENNITDTNLLEDQLLEKITDRDNMNRAFKKVKKNKGAAGIDDMGIDELLDHLKENGKDLVEAIQVGKYRPKPVKRVEIPKG